MLSMMIQDAYRLFSTTCSPRSTLPWNRFIGRFSEQPCYRLPDAHRTTDHTADEGSLLAAGLLFDQFQRSARNLAQRLYAEDFQR
jgi:hypothetical protein